MTYLFDPNPVNTHMLLMNEIPSGSRVLEIGTASGYLGEYMIWEKHCEVWGIEPVAELYQEARAHGYQQLFNQTAEAFLENPAAAGQTFDVILLADVLEHMVFPEMVLTKLKRFVKPTGRCVISLPNIAHYSTRFHLLRGRWEMQDSGILDRTHLRFFTRRTARRLIEDAGLVIEKDRPSAGYIERWMRRLMHVGKRMLFLWPEFFAPQFIFVARLKRDT